MCAKLFTDQPECSIQHQTLWFTVLHRQLLMHFRCIVHVHLILFVKIMFWFEDFGCGKIRLQSSVNNYAVSSILNSGVPLLDKSHFARPGMNLLIPYVTHVTSGSIVVPYSLLFHIAVLSFKHCEPIDLSIA